MLYLLRERGVEVPRLAATIFALGIHEDTGSLTYPRTTIRDAEMLAASMRLGASQPLIERYLHSALTDDQRVVLMEMVDLVRLERVRGLDVHTVALDVLEYVDGLSVIAHKLMELINAEVLLQAVGMEDRVFVTARSRAGSVDVGALLRSIDGGGHAQAASAVVRGRTAAGDHRRAARATLAEQPGRAHGRRDHEPARTPHRRRHHGHRGPRHRPALRPLGHLRARGGPAWSASSLGAISTRPCGTAWGTPPSRGS